MKVEFEKGDYKYGLVGILVVAFVLTSWLQRKSTQNLKEIVKENNKEIVTLQEDKNDLLISIDVLEGEKQDLISRADSLELKENYYKNRFYVTNKKLKTFMDNYNSSSVDDKNKLFTGDLSN